MVTSKEKIKDILNFVQKVIKVDKLFMTCLKQELEYLVIIAQTEGAKEVKNMILGEKE